MNYQNEKLPEGLTLQGSTSQMTHETVLKGLLKDHKTSAGRYGLLTVAEGSLQFVWEDTPYEALDADKNHPIIIEPERAHHIEITGPVSFRVEFYG